jgi:hypothetical protein
MALSFIFIFLLFFLAPVDTDLGWHLRYGEYFLKTGHFMRHNELTYFLSNYLWNNSYSFYQVLVFIVHKLFGLIGLTFASGLLAAVAFLFFSKIQPNLKKINLVAFLVITWLGWNVFHLGFRAQIFTFLGLVILFYLLKRYKEFPKLAYFLPAIFFFWANLHGGFVLGLIFLAIAVISTRQLFIGLITSIAATLINPYGFGIYKEAVRHIQVPLGTLIAEWVPPTITVKIFLVIATFVLISLLISSQNKNKLFWTISLIIIGILTLQSRRNLPIFALIGTLSLLETFGKDLVRLEKDLQFQKLVNVGIVLGIFYLLFTHVPKNFSLATNWQQYCYQGMVVYPCKAVQFIKTNKPEGKNVFSAYEWGGFLEWQLPEYKFFVDGRMPAWPTPQAKSPYTIYLEIIQAQPGYQEKLDKYGTDWLLIGSGSFLDLELSQKDNKLWKNIYKDGAASIYLKQKVK